MKPLLASGPTRLLLTAAVATLTLAALAAAIEPTTAGRPGTTVLKFPLAAGETRTIDPNNSYPAPPGQPNAHGMTRPRLFLIFYGPTWPTPDGRAEEAAVLQCVQDVLDSGYLDGMTQYGLQKVAFNRSTDFVEEQQTPLTMVFPQPADDPDVDQRALQGFLQTTLSRHNLPAPRAGDDWRTSTIYVVVGDSTSPGTKAAVRWGENEPWRVDPRKPGSASLAEMVWVGWDAGQPRGPHGEPDGTTSVFGHELVEATSGVGLTVRLPVGRRSNGDQIADDDAAAHTARLAASEDRRQVLVQSYYSVVDGQFIIPGVPSAGAAPSMPGG